MKTALIRFVGGTWHNQLRFVRMLHQIDVPVSKPITMVGQSFAAPSFRIESYRLYRFYTEHRTIYSQYVHESLIHKGEPVREAFDEQFPTMEFDPTPLLLMRIATA